MNRELDWEDGEVCNVRVAIWMWGSLCLCNSFVEGCRHSVEKLREEDMEKDCVECVFTDLALRPFNLFAVAGEANPRKGEAIATKL